MIRHLVRLAACHVGLMHGGVPSDAVTIYQVAMSNPAAIAAAPAEEKSVPSASPSAFDRCLCSHVRALHVRVTDVHSETAPINPCRACGLCGYFEAA